MGAKGRTPNVNGGDSTRFWCSGGQTRRSQTTRKPDVFRLPSGMIQVVPSFFFATVARQGTAQELKSDCFLSSARTNHPSKLVYPGPRGRLILPTKRSRKIFRHPTCDGSPCIIRLKMQAVEVRDNGNKRRWFPLSEGQNMSIFPAYIQQRRRLRSFRHKRPS